MILFVSNLIPSVVDSCFKHIIDDVDKTDLRLVLYFIPGVCFLTILLLRRPLFFLINSRIGVTVGSGLLAGGCYFFWPINRKENDEIG